jgi:myosin heavy subunit
MMSEKTDQSIIISGESGAGKTVKKRILTPHSRKLPNKS